MLLLRLICGLQPHTQRVEKVVGIGFQPGLDPGKIVSASQAGDIQFLDIRNHSSAYLTIEAHRGSLTALAVRRHAPIIASGSAKQLIKVFSLEGDQLGTIRYYPVLPLWLRKLADRRYMTWNCTMASRNLSGVDSASASKEVTLAEVMSLT
ncbi:hypothetical protein AHAS_Ahas20G0272800 [Arachis hypogaea]